ncbi:MAG: hypothetical protein M3440_15005 [Chloroflexota bacterium]|nr:hypothetical protein [Chloroflexota bacterium]
MTATKPTTITRLSDHLRTLDERYRDHHDDVDHEVSAGLACTACGHVGLAYRGFVRPATGAQCRSYRAFAVCTYCWHSEEI